MSNDNPIVADTVATTLAEDAETFFPIALERIDETWQQLFLEGCAFDMDDPDAPPSDESMQLAEAFDVELGDEGLDDPESDDDTSLWRFRKRFHRLQQVEAIDFAALQLVGKALAALWDAYAEYASDTTAVEATLENLTTPTSGAEEFDEAAFDETYGDEGAPEFLSMEALGDDDEQTDDEWE